MKRIISLVLSVAMVLAFCSVPSFADSVVKITNVDGATLDGSSFSGDINTTKNEGKTVRVYGWIASTEEISSFGYKLGDAATITDAAFKTSTEKAVFNAATANGCDYASRFDISVPVSKGTYTLKLVANTTGGEHVIWSVECTEDAYVSVEAAPGGGIGVWMGLASEGRLDNHGVEFNAASGFNKISIPIYWAAKTDLNMKFELFTRGADYDSSVAGTALYTKDFTVNGDNAAGITFDLGKVYDAGAYVFRISVTGGAGYFVLPAAASTYSTSRIIFHGPSYHFNVNFIEDTSLDYYFAKLPGTEGYAEMIGGNLISNGSTPVDLKGGDIAVRFTVPEGKKLYSITGLASPTWGNAEGTGSDAKATVYAWNTDYATSVAGDVLATSQVIGHPDNQDMVFVLDKTVAAGDVLVVFSATNTGSVGFWCGDNKENATDAFVNGANKGLYPRTSVSYVVINNQTIGISEINANGMSFDTLFANGNTVVDGNARAYLDENFPNGIIDLTKAITTLGVRGWAGFKQPIESFGYIIDNNAPVFGEFSVAAEDAVKAAGGEYAMRYAVTVPVDSIKGASNIVAVAKLLDGTVVKFDGSDKHSHDTTLLYINELKEAVSRDELKVGETQMGSVGGNPATATINLADYVGKDLTLWGWYGNNINIVQFGYIVDDGEAVYADSFKVEAAQDVVNAVVANVGNNAHASRFKILVPIEKGSHTVKAVCDIGGVDVVLWTVNYSAGEDETPVITDEEVQPTYRFHIDAATGSTSIANGDRDNPAVINVTVDYGTTIELLGWFISDQGMTKLQASIDGGDYVDATGEYRARADVLGAFASENWPADLNATPGIGLDADYLDITGSNTLTPGTHTIALRAIGADGTEYDCGTVNATVKGYRVSLDNATNIENKNPGGLCTPASGDITVDEGTVIEILGWVITDQGMTKVQLSIDDGEFVDATGEYRARGDVLDAFSSESWNAELNNQPGFGTDADWIDLTGTDALAAGSHKIVLRAVGADGSTYDFATLNVTVNAVAEPKVSTDNTTYAVDADVTVTFEGSSTNKDWIAIAPSGTEYTSVPSAEKVWVYTSGTQTSADAAIAEGSVVLSMAGLVPGQYTVYFFANDGYDVLATAEITVEEDVPPTTEEPPVTEEPVKTGDFALTMFAVIMVLAMGAAVVFMKKRAF